MTEVLTPELVGELLSLLAHDLRNPLSALHSNVGFLGSLPGHDSDGEEAIADALLSCDGLGHIIDSVEILSQVLGGSLEYERSPFQVATLIKEALGGTAALAASHEVSVMPEESATRAQHRVLAHREMASRALLALIRNSVQHAPPGSVVRLSVIETKDTCAIIVTDDGTPLSEQATESAFTAAGQISTKSIRGGRYSRGLGLYCAKVCAEAAGAVASFYPDAKPANAFVLSLVLDR